MVKDRPVRLTAAGKARLGDELRRLETEQRPALSARIHDATANAHPADNGEVEELKEAFVLIDARIRDLGHMLERAEIVQPDPTVDTVALGSVVTLRGDDGVEETWTVVSPEEANTLDGTISTESPVGRAVLGCRAGDAPAVITPGGAIVFTVVSVA